MSSTLAPEEAGRSLVQQGATEQRRVTFDEIEMRADGDKITFQGHAAVFDRLSDDLGGFREKIQRGAFRKVLDSSPDVRMLFNHNPDIVLARSTINDGPGLLDLREDPKGLRTYAELVPTQWAKDLRQLVQAGVVTQQSFSFRIFPDGKDVWEEVDGELVRTIISFGALFDIGPVVFPAYPQTDAAIRSLVIGGARLVTDDGEIAEDILCDLAWKIHRGEQEATDHDRAALDAVFARTNTVSPWTAERTFRAASQEPELLAAVPGKRATIVLEEEPSGQVAFRLAARKRRLRAHDPSSKET